MTVQCTVQVSAKLLLIFIHKYCNTAEQVSGLRGPMTELGKSLTDLLTDAAPLQLS